MAAPRVLSQCLAAKLQHRRSTHRKGTVRQLRGSARGGSVPLTARRAAEARRERACRADRRGGNQVVARRVVRDGERSLSCPGDGRRAARRMPKGWRARCRETRRGCRMRRQGNTRRRAIPHHGAGSGYPDGYRVAHYNSPPPLPAAVAAAGRGFSIPKRTVRTALRRTFATVRFSTLLTTFPLTRADAAAGDRGRGCGARLRDCSVPVGADGGRLHDIAGETHAVAPARFEASAAGRDLRDTAAPSAPHPWRRAAPPPGALVPAGPRAAQSVVAQSVRRRTRPNRSSGPAAGRTGRCAGTRPRPGCR